MNMKLCQTWFQNNVANLVWPKKIWYDMLWYDIIRYDMIWFNMKWYHSLPFDMTWYYIIRCWCYMVVRYSILVWYCKILYTWHYGTIWLDMIRYYIGRRGTRTSLTCRANQFTDPTPECQPRMSTPYPDMGELLWRVRDKYIPTPWKINMEPQKLRFGSDDVPCQKRMIVRFQPFIFRGIR